MLYGFVDSVPIGLHSMPNFANKHFSKQLFSHFHGNHINISERTSWFLGLDAADCSVFEYGQLEAEKCGKIQELRGR